MLFFFSLVPAVRSLGAVSSCQKHTLPDLPYAYNALEPCISGDIMQVHHQKHHATYVNNLNAAEEKLAAAVAESKYTCTPLYRYRHPVDGFKDENS